MSVCCYYFVYIAWTYYFINSQLGMYRIVGNFRGYKISRIVEDSVKTKFSLFNFATNHLLVTRMTMRARAPPSSNVWRANEREVARTRGWDVWACFFCVEAMVRGYHTYLRVWTAMVGELPCQQETVNLWDSFAVAVLKDEVVVGNVPRKIPVGSVCCCGAEGRGDCRPRS